MICVALLLALFSVGECAGCGDLQNGGKYKKCTGSGLLLSRPDATSFNRESASANAVPWVNNNYEHCQALCDYVGAPGCCEFQNDQDACMFYFEGSTATDKAVFKYKPPASSNIITYAARHASMCTYDSSEYVMLPYNRNTGCDWNDADKAGRSEKSNSVNLAQCEAFCRQNPDCLFMSLSPNGRCRTYKTCNYHDHSGGSETMKQKAVKTPETVAALAASSAGCANDDSKAPMGSCDNFYKMYGSSGFDMCEMDASFKKICCATCSKAEASAYAGVFDVQQKTHSDTQSHFIYGFAVLGFGVVAYGAGRHYFGKVVEGSLYSTV